MQHHPREIQHYHEESLTSRTFRSATFQIQHIRIQELHQLCHNTKGERAENWEKSGLHETSSRQATSVSACSDQLVNVTLFMEGQQHLNMPSSKEIAEASCSTTLGQ
ncbi:hypothetical protein Ancab_021709 [Ancistrocladus abbreviatus]